MEGRLVKERIKRAFSRGAGTYDTYGGFQREVAEELASLLKEEGGMVLDVGCGTGFLTEGLSRLLPGSRVFAMDLSHAMVKTATKKVEGIIPLTADLEDIPFKDDSFHLLASSLAYQWAIDLRKAFSEASRVLKRGGLFIISILGKESLKELRESYRAARDATGLDGLPPLMTFPSGENILEVLKGAGFKEARVWSSRRERSYRDMWHLLKTLKGIGATNPFPPGDTSLRRLKTLKEMDRVYRERFSCKGSITATYEVIFACGRKGP